MSFILDALKKSENERQRHVGPSLADAPLRRARVDRPWWAVAVAALLIVNLGVLIIVLVRDNAAAKSADVAAPAVMPSANVSAPIPVPITESTGQPALLPAQPVLRAHRSPPAASPAVRSLADEASAAPETDAEPRMDAALAASAAAPSDAPPVQRIQPPTVTPVPADPTFKSVPNPGGAVSRNDEVLPTATDLAAGGTSLPELKLDIHVFSKNPPERFVFVNMRKYLEGQALQEGPTVERITTDGVVLNQNGLRYVLPRQ